MTVRQDLARLKEAVNDLAGRGRARVRSAAPAGADPEAAAAENFLYEFVKQAWVHTEPAPFFDGWHIACVCDHLQAVTAGMVENLLINIPPGHSKSLITSVLWPVWEWVRDARVRWFFASYDQRLSTRDSVKCRALINSPWFQDRWGDRFKLADDQNMKTYYETDKGGYRLATSVCGHGMGERPDRVVVDDAHDPQGAESESERQSVLEWWDLTMSTRGVSRGVRRVIIMQRLAEDDLAGHVLREGGYVHVCLPLRFERGRMAPSPVRDRLGRPWMDRRTEEGELLAPQQFPEAAVKSMERRLGSYGVAGQLQQRPAPRGGALFKRSWWENGRARYSLEHGENIVRAGRPGAISVASCSVFAIVDGGASSKVTSDPTVITIFACGTDGDLYVLWCGRARLEVEEIIPVLDDMCDVWRPAWVGIESNGFQIWFVKEARRRDRYPHIPAVRELDPQGRSKAARAAPAIIRAEQGRILLPFADDPANPWAADFEDELYSFTGKEGRVDDRTDTVAYACLEIDRLGLDLDGADMLPPPDNRRKPGVWN